MLPASKENEVVLKAQSKWNIHRHKLVCNSGGKGGVLHGESGFGTSLPLRDDSYFCCEKSAVALNGWDRAITFTEPQEKRLHALLYNLCRRKVQGVLGKA